MADAAPRAPPGDLRRAAPPQRGVRGGPGAALWRRAEVGGRRADEPGREVEVRRRVLVLVLEKEREREETRDRERE